MKTKTREEKFKRLPIAQYKTETIRINGKEIENNVSGKVLGLTISRTGFIGPIARTIKESKPILSQLKTFNKLTQKMKTTIVKTLLIPVLEYPSLLYACHL